uniref:Uncharacterized protein n=1 Tax=Solanum lycopersicum TaxID=4081 RepID=A0A3Q7HBR8_SOLLC
MNSSSASFSNRLLVGSQERCASISSSAKSAEGKLDIEPTISSLSGDARKKCNENVVAIAESNVKSPVSCIYNERTASHHKRMSRSIDAIEYNGNLNSKGNKWQRQLSQKISLHDGMLNSRTDRLHDEKKHLVADIRHDLFSEHFRSTKKRKTLCELGLQLLNNNSAAKTKFDSSGVKSDVCAHQSPNVYSLPETAQDCKDGEHDDLVDIDELVGGEYIKLLNLDNDTDEESYRLAIEMPLSPTLPEIQCHSSVALVPINTPLYEGFLNAETVASSGNFDVINVEINSNKVKHPTIDPPKKSSLPEKKDHVDSSKRLNLDTACKLSCSSDLVTLEALCRSDLAAPATEGLQISSERRAVSLQDGFAKYCVIFSNNNDAKTISSVYHATSRCLAQCSVSSDTSLRSILMPYSDLEGSKCPFSESAATMDVVASSLLDSLKSYCCSAVGLDLMESLNSSRYGIKCYGKRTDESTDNVDLVQWAYVTLRDSSQFIDTLALMELVAGFMSWDWTFDKIACPLLKLLEYCSTEHNAAAIATLLGQLGRSGLEAFGYEDVRIQRLRSSFCALLSQCDSKRMDLHLQFSIGIALVGLIPLRFEELVGSNIEVAPAANPTDCLRKWFSLLSSEQRLLFKARIFC